MTLVVLNYGAIIQKLLLKDSEGNYTNVVVGYNHPSRYLTDKVCLGACVGRYAGRISKGGFIIDRERFFIHTDNDVHLHGGKEGFHKKYWTIEKIVPTGNPSVTLSYKSTHLEEGYPGNLMVQVTYQLIDNKLHITHRAKTDRSTVVNLTNHSYFKLDNSPYIDGYELQLNCPYYLETLNNLLPTGNVLPVSATNFDFLKPKQIDLTRLDTPFVRNPKNTIVAKVSSKETGISLEVQTNQPAVVVYTPTDFPGICFETQNLPDAPNQPSFPSSILRPGEIYNNSSTFTFAID